VDANSTCPACAVELPRGERRETHRYFNASPECWSVFNEVLASEYSDVTMLAAVHQLTVDTYAVQHAGGAHPDKSVTIHLVGLRLVLESGLRPTEIAPYLQRVATVSSTWPNLAPPTKGWSLTIVDVALSDDHVVTVRKWAAEVWRAWAPFHPTIREPAEMVAP
jgi:hypothetical protein